MNEVYIPVRDLMDEVRHHISSSCFFSQILNRNINLDRNNTLCLEFYNEKMKNPDERTYYLRLCKGHLQERAMEYTAENANYDGLYLIRLVEVACSENTDYFISSSNDKIIYALGHYARCIGSSIELLTNSDASVFSSDAVDINILKNSIMNVVKVDESADQLVTTISKNRFHNLTLILINVNGTIYPAIASERLLNMSNEKGQKVLTTIRKMLATRALQQTLAYFNEEEFSNHINSALSLVAPDIDINASKQ